MQNRKLIKGLLTPATVVAVLLVVTSAAASPPAQDPAASAISLAGTVASKISYQGRLTDAAGNPLNGNYNLVFQLWDDATAGSQVGSDIVRNNVPVSAGLFTVELDVPQAAFNGQALWLRIQVGGQWLTPRQELLPAPYALSLRPGAQIRGDSADPAVIVTNGGLLSTAVLAHGDGVGLDAQGQTGVYAVGWAVGVDASGMTGVRGQGDVGVRGDGLTGVHGESEIGYGVIGVTHAPMTVTTAAGVYGESMNGHGVEGVSQFDVGVFGQSHGGFGAGVSGAGVTGVFGSGGMVGVSGYTESDDATGVQGTATGYNGTGVAGDAQFGTGVLGAGETGVKGTSSVGVGVRGEGSAGVEGVGQSAEGVLGTSESTYGMTGEGPLGGVRGTSTNGDGVEGHSQSGTGVFGVSTSGDGVVGNSQSGVAVYGNTGSGTAAVMGEGPTGVHGRSSADFGEGVHGHGSGSNTEGVLGTSDHAVGVWGVTGATWGLGTPQNLWVGGSCTGCTVVFVGQNGDTSSLEPGDVVVIDGIVPPLKGQQTPVLKVRRATAAGGGFLGVVQARAAVTTTEAPVLGGDSDQTVTIEMPGLAPGTVAPGNYLFVVVQGLIQVRADASSVAIQIGDPVGPVAEAGLVRKVNSGATAAGVLGRALEPLDRGIGLIWVLVLGR